MFNYFARSQEHPTQDSVLIQYCWESEPQPAEHTGPAVHEGNYKDRFPPQAFPPLGPLTTTPPYYSRHKPPLHVSHFSLPQTPVSLKLRIRRHLPAGPVQEGGKPTAQE